MSYHFRLILPYFTVFGKTMSYFWGSSRTTVLKIGPTLKTDLCPTDKTTDGYANWTDSQRRLEAGDRPAREQEKRQDRLPRSGTLGPKAGRHCLGRETRSRAQTSR